MFKAILSSCIKLVSPPSIIFAKVLDDNTFINPRYNENEKQGRSNWNTEKYLKTYTRYHGNIHLPLGYLDELFEYCKSEGLEIDVHDERTAVTATYQPLQGITLRPYQQRAVKSAIQHNQGVIIAPTGSGKSILGLELIRKLQQKAIIIVSRGELAKQWVAVIKERLGIDAGFIGGGEWRAGTEITVAMVQTLETQQEALRELSSAFGLILTDECHHTPAESFSEVIGQFTARYRYGLSATPQRRDGLEPLIYRTLGPAIAIINKTEVELLGATVPALVEVVETGFKLQNSNSWADFQTALATSEKRNQLIVDGLQELRGPTLVLTDRIQHAEDISKLLLENSLPHTLAHGKLKSSERKAAMEAMRTSKITVGTTSLLGEGLDFPAWSVLILASPISSEIKLLQAIGRVTRASSGKSQAFVYDLKDDCGFAGASFKKRFEIYKKHKIWVKFQKEKAADQGRSNGLKDYTNKKPA